MAVVGSDCTWQGTRCKLLNAVPHRADVCCQLVNGTDLIATLNVCVSTVGAWTCAWVESKKGEAGIQQMELASCVIRYRWTWMEGGVVPN